MPKGNSLLIDKVDQLLRGIDEIKKTWWTSSLGGGFKDSAGFEAMYTEAISLIEDMYGRGSPNYQRIIYFYNEGHLHALEQTKGLLLGIKASLGSCRGDAPGVAQAWSAVRAALQNNYFYEIKEIVGLAGLDLTLIAHLEQQAIGGASKGQLMTAVDRVFSEFKDIERKRFLTIVAEEVLKRKPETRGSLVEHLSRLGWTLVENALIPIELLDQSELTAISGEARHDLVKAAQRFRDGDLSGAISAACGAVDSATAGVYSALGLGDPTTTSFQERCNKALAARGVLPRIETDLASLGWDVSDIKLFRENFKGALNQGAYIMQTLRSRMGDVHGTKPILKPLVFDSLKWAELLVRSLIDE